MKNNDLKLFALNSTKEFGQEVADYLDIPLSKHIEKTFQDGENFLASAENVRGRSVFVIQSLYGDKHESVNDKLMKLLIFVGSLKDASAERITVVSPYMCFSRQDRKINSREPISSKYLIKMFEAIRANRILTLDVHNPAALQNSSFEINIDLLESNIIFANYLEKTPYLNENIVVMSCDAGGLQRTRKFIKVLEKKYGIKAGYACLNKIHDGDIIDGVDLMGDSVRNKVIIIYDDLISSGKSISCCIESVKRCGAKSAIAVCSHGLFVGDFENNLGSNFLEHIFITDSIIPFRVKGTKIEKKISIIRSTEVFSKAISHIFNNESISELLANC